MSGEQRRFLQSFAIAGLALAVCGCSNKVRVFAKGSTGGDGAIFVARQVPMYEAMYRTELRFDLPEAARLIITFSAQGTVQPNDLTADLMPPLVVQCRLDGKPCAPGQNESTAQFKFPPERPQVWVYDTRAYTWVVPQAASGGHP